MRPHGVLLLAARSLRVRMRDAWQAGLRALLCVALLCAVWNAWEMRSRLGAAGFGLWVGLIWTNLFAVPILGITVMSTSLVEERENGTLGLLRLTGMSPWSILLGKSLADLVTALLVLGLQVPFAFLLVALGGLSPAQVVSTFAIVACYILFVWGIATAASASAHDRVQAAWRTGITVGAIVGIPLLCTLAGSAGRSVPPAIVQVLGELVFLGINDVAGSRSKPPLVPMAALVHLAIGLLALLLAAHWLAREHQPVAGSTALRDRAAIRAPVRTPIRTPIRAPIRSPARAPVQGARRPGAWERALVWKETRHGTMRVRWAFYAVVAFAGMLLPEFMGLQPARGLTFRGPSPAAQVAGGALVFLEPVVLFDVALLASRVFADEVHERTLAALATLPLGTRAWFNAKVIGIARLVAPGLLLIGIAAGVLQAESRHLSGPIAFLRLLAWAADLAIVFQLTVWLSLRHDRGAAFGSLAIVAVANLLVRWAAASLGNSGDNLRVALGLMEVAACLPLHLGIMRRLRDLAAR